jgi:hypothetical protein
MSTEKIQFASSAPRKTSGRKLTMLKKNRQTSPEKTFLGGALNNKPIPKSQAASPTDNYWDFFSGAAMSLKPVV